MQEVRLNSTITKKWSTKCMKLLDFIINVEKDLNCVLDIPEQFLDSYNSNDWIEIELKIKDTTYTHRIQKKEM